jgi:hypothetical protein
MEPGGRAPLPGTLKDRQKRLWRQASLPIGAPMGNLLDGSSARDIERMKGSLGMECLTVKRLIERALRGPPLLGTLRVRESPVGL